MKKRIISFALAALLLLGQRPVEVEAAIKSDSMFENFITTDGTKLMDGDKELKFISLNYPQATSDNSWEHANAMKTIKTMGGNVTRTYTIPVNNGLNGSKAYVTGVDENGVLTFNEDALNELADSIKAHGVIQPIIVTKKDDYYQIIAGERRWRASKKVGLKTIPAIVNANKNKIASKFVIFSIINCITPFLRNKSSLKKLNLTS